MRNFDRAFQRALDMTPRRFDEQWREALKKEYWPGVAHQEDPDQIARRLTDHRRDESNLNTSPSISPLVWRQPDKRTKSWCLLLCAIWLRDQGCDSKIAAFVN